MIYKRSSFIRWLQEDCECEVFPVNDARTLKIVNGPASAYMFVSKRDRIDYEEIYILYRKLCLADLPGDKDLERVE